MCFGFLNALNAPDAITEMEMGGVGLGGGWEGEKDESLFSEPLCSGVWNAMLERSTGEVILASVCYFFSFPLSLHSLPMAALGSCIPLCPVCAPQFHECV